MSASPGDSILSSIPLTVENDSELEYQAPSGCTPPVHEDFTERMKDVSIKGQKVKGHGAVEVDAAMAAPPISTQEQHKVVYSSKTNPENYGTVQNGSTLNTTYQPQVHGHVYSANKDLSENTSKYQPSPKLMQQTLETQREAFVSLKQTGEPTIKPKVASISKQSQNVPPQNKSVGKPQANVPQPYTCETLGATSLISQPEDAPPEPEPAVEPVDPEKERKERINQMYADERYDMDHPKRGQALVFSVVHFDPDTKQTERCINLL